MTGALALLLSLLSLSDSFQQTKSDHNHLLPWRLARGGRRAKFMSKLDLINYDKPQIESESSEESYKDDNFQASFVEDLENQLRNKFSSNGVYRNQFKKIIEDFPSLETAIGNTFI